MGTVISITGLPLVAFEFDYIPSANEAINKARTHWSSGHGFTKKWRAQGEDIARRFIHETHQVSGQHIIKQRAFLWVKVYRAAEWPTYDIHNPYLKPIADGFTDAGIWQDDDWPNVPYVMFSWQAYGPSEERVNKFVIEIHELDAVTINGAAQILPSGRIK
jgi:hypothetical protein